MASGNLLGPRSEEAVRPRFDGKNRENTSLFGRFASVGTFLAFEAFHIAVYLPKSSVTSLDGSEPDDANCPYHTQPVNLKRSRTCPNK